MLKIMQKCEHNYIPTSQPQEDIVNLVDDSLHKVKYYGEVLSSLTQVAM